MATPKVEVSKRVPAPRNMVFQAWTQPGMLQRWFAPGPLTVPEADVDAKVGGRYRIAMQNPDGEKYVCIGSYKEVTPDTKLVFTWAWEGAPGPETTVTVELEDDGEGTLVKLTHVGFPSEEEAKKHEEGWVGCLEKLAAQKP